MINLFGGAIIILLSFLVFFVLCPTYGDTAPEWKHLYAATDTYYFTAVICFVLFGTGVAIQTFRKFKINYVFIFELDNHNKVIHHQIYRFALMFTFVWVLCLTWQVGMIKLAPAFYDSHVQYFPIALLVSFLLLCLMPCRFFYGNGRLELAKTLGHILISPFGKVHFRHFFLADIITSMTSPLQHLLFIGCYYTEGAYSSG